MKSIIRDIGLAGTGRQKIEWVRKNMPLLRSLEDEYRQTQPFKGIRVAISVHLEAKTAYLAKVIAAGGGEVSVMGSNPLSTQDDVAAALAEDGHPAEIMDMSFTLQAMCAHYVLRNYSKLGNKVIDVPEEIDKKVADMKLRTWGVKIDRLTKDQKKYLESWVE